MLLAQKGPDCHESHLVPIFPCVPETPPRRSLTAGSKSIKNNGHGVLINREIIDGDIFAKNTRLVQGLVPLDTSLRGDKQRRTRACQIGGLSVVPKNMACAKGITLRSHDGKANSTRATAGHGKPARRHGRVAYRASRVEINAAKQCKTSWRIPCLLLNKKPEIELSRCIIDYSALKSGSEFKRSFVFIKSTFFAAVVFIFKNTPIYNWIYFCFILMFKIYYILINI